MDTDKKSHMSTDKTSVPICENHELNTQSVLICAMRSEATNDKAIRKI